MTASTREQIVAKLHGALDRASNGRAKLAQLDGQAKIIEDIGLSSLDLLDLRCELEELWQTKLSDEETAQLRTVDDIVSLIESRVCAAQTTTE